MINVHDIYEQALKENALSGILQFFMKHIHERDLLKIWQEVADLLPKFAKVNIGIDYIELILFYTLTKIRQSDILEVERMLKSHLNPKKREKIIGSIAHYWEKQAIDKGIRKEKMIIAKNLIKAGLKTELIIALIGLKKEEIEKLEQIA
ncbi:RpnC/YadD family protein [Rickettsia akari]|uniref:hypothetical protein n=1 Tax=Rickettsia akari TaxID=786 RepID=UPI0000461F45|nr:hypothetical protein [Rickettsia akari]